MFEIVLAIAIVVYGMHISKTLAKCREESLRVSETMTGYNKSFIELEEVVAEHTSRITNLVTTVGNEDTLKMEWMRYKGQITDLLEDLTRRHSQVSGKLGQMKKLEEEQQVNAMLAEYAAQQQGKRILDDSSVIDKEGGERQRVPATKRRHSMINRNQRRGRNGV